ncbi:unnamed protein product [Urochloa humidicola]
MSNLGTVLDQAGQGKALREQPLLSSVGNGPRSDWRPRVGISVSSLTSMASGTASSIRVETKGRALREQPHGPHIDGVGNGSGGNDVDGDSDREGSGTNRGGDREGSGTNRECGVVGMESVSLGGGCGVERWEMLTRRW